MATIRPKAKREAIAYARPHETTRYLTVPQLIERWSCSGMTIERLIRNDPDFPPALRIGLGARTRLFSYEAIVEFEKSKIGAGSKAA
jgi:predicted DNA-binding transcriptional regulator AlpA